MRSLLLMLSVVVCSALTVPAHATEEFYWRTSRNALVHWEGAQVRIPVDPELVDYFGPAIKQALDAAAAQWAVSPNIPLITFDFEPTAQDRMNAEMKRGNWLGLARSWDYGDELAITVSTSDATSGSVLATQVWVNARRPLELFPLDTPDMHAYDLQGVLTHEFGHVLGLGEGPEHTFATMNPNFKRGETHQRTIDGIDEEAVTSLYDQVAREPAADASSCSLNAGANRASHAGIVWAILLTVCVLGRTALSSRRQRRYYV
jgi:hypothetical protein